MSENLNEIIDFLADSISIGSIASEKISKLYKYITSKFNSEQTKLKNFEKDPNNFVFKSDFYQFLKNNLDSNDINNIYELYESIKSENNINLGYSNEINGKNNLVSGTGNIIKGNNSIVLGKNNRIG